MAANCAADLQALERSLRAEADESARLAHQITAATAKLGQDRAKAQAQA